MRAHLSNAWPILSLAGAMVLVGSSVVAGKVLAENLPIFLAGMLRFAGALAVLLPLLRWLEGGWPRLTRRTWALAALQALCGSFLFTVFLLWGVERAGAAAAGVVASTTPACMAVVAWLFLGERPSRRALLGVGFAVVGLAAVNWPTDTALPPGGWPALLAGNALVFAAVVFESLFLLIRKAVREPLTPLALSTLVSGFGLLWFLPLGAWEAARLDWTAVPAAGWWAVGYYAVAVTVLAYLLWFAGIPRVGAATAGAMTAVMPVSALALSALVLGEALGPGHVLGCAAVLAGILLAALPGPVEKQLLRVEG